MPKFRLTVSSDSQIEIEAASLDAAKREAKLLEAMQFEWFDLNGIGKAALITGAAVTKIEEVIED